MTKKEKKQLAEVMVQECESDLIPGFQDKDSYDEFIKEVLSDFTSKLNLSYFCQTAGSPVLGFRLLIKSVLQSPYEYSSKLNELVKAIDPEKLKVIDGEPQLV